MVKMLSTLGILKSFWSSKNLTTDNLIFRLHYRVTVIFLVACSLLVTTKQYFADPINCKASTDTELYSQTMINNYCWIHHTYTIPEAYTKPDAIYHGVDNAPEGVPRRYQAYYQWVHVVLFIQAILFYLPRLLWKIFEKGRLSQILVDLSTPLIDPEKADKFYGSLASYLKISSGSNYFYSWSYVACETINIINAVGQIYLMDTFLGGEFSTYGVKVVGFLNFKPDQRVDPMDKIFPKVAKCEFKKYGPSGNIQNHDVLCILPQNVLNEKIYVVLWFWLVILACLSTLLLFYRVIVIFSTRLRVWVIKTSNHHIDSHIIEAIVVNISFSDWYFLYLVSQNIDQIHFRCLADELFKKMFTMDVKDMNSETKSSEDDEKTPVLHPRHNEKPPPSAQPQRIPMTALPQVSLRPTYPQHGKY